MVLRTGPQLQHSPVYTVASTAQTHGALTGVEGVRQWGSRGTFRVLAEIHKMLLSAILLSGLLW